MLRRVRIASSGIYLPSKIVTSEMMDKILDVESGWSLKKSGVKKRHFVDGLQETASFMGAAAARQALTKANYGLGDIDAIVCASATMEQPLPFNAALLQEALGEEANKISCLDINVSCLSFLAAFDVMSYLIQSKRFKRILIVSSEIASGGLDYGHKESASLMGDGAAAVIIESSEGMTSGKIIASDFKNYSEGAHLSEVPGGGTKISVAHKEEIIRSDYTFKMDGLKVYRLASQHLSNFCESLFQKAGIKNWDDLDFVIPHQASKMSMRLIRTKLGIPESKWMEHVEEHGNTIASSLPMGIHMAIEKNKIKRGDKVMILGTAAGLSLGAMIWEY
jgi:3-oxoacyl-[acyl-carrier-protein] synthase-3